jgi:hypothetical protein
MKRSASPCSSSQKKQKLFAKKLLKLPGLDDRKKLAATFDNSETFTDLTLFFAQSNTTLHVHKIVLITQSEYFQK